VKDRKLMLMLKVRLRLKATNSIRRRKQIKRKRN
jgi:hypothetical protein